MNKVESLVESHINKYLDGDSHKRVPRSEFAARMLQDEIPVFYLRQLSRTIAQAHLPDGLIRA
jgi:hypothetical protein